MDKEPRPMPSDGIEYSSTSERGSCLEVILGLIALTGFGLPIYDYFANNGENIQRVLELLQQAFGN